MIRSYGRSILAVNAILWNDLWNANIDSGSPEKEKSEIPNIKITTVGTY